MEKRSKDVDIKHQEILTTTRPHKNKNPEPNVNSFKDRAKKTRQT